MRGDESGVLTAQSGLGRRSLLRGSFFGMAGLAAVSLVGCGDEDEPSSAVGTYATVRQYENVQNAGAVIEEVNASFLPLMKEIPGFVAYYFMDVGDDGGRMVSVSVFEDESGALDRTGEQPSGYSIIRISFLRRHWPKKAESWSASCVGASAVVQARASLPRRPDQLSPRQHPALA